MVSVKLSKKIKWINRWVGFSSWSVSFLLIMVILCRWVTNKSEGSHVFVIAVKIHVKDSNIED